PPNRRATYSSRMRTSWLHVPVPTRDVRRSALRRWQPSVAVQVPPSRCCAAQLPVPNGAGIVHELRLLTPGAEGLERVERVDRQGTLGGRIAQRVPESGQMLRLVPEAREDVRVPDQDDQLESLLAQLPGRRRRQLFYQRQPEL